MTPQPKPVRRTPKPRKRIARKAPLRRSSSPIARKQRPRAQRKSRLAELVLEADRLWSELIRRPGRCAIKECRRRRIDAAHCIRRGYVATRWDLDNGLPLCRLHHRFYTDNPIAWGAMWASIKGMAVARRLSMSAYVGARKTIPYMEAIVAGLKACSQDDGGKHVR